MMATKFVNGEKPEVGKIYTDGQMKEIWRVDEVLGRTNERAGHDRRGVVIMVPVYEIRYTSIPRRELYNG